MYNLIVIIGPTASGKTALAVDIANYYSTAVISADSRQVYKGMNIGTGKDLDEYHNVPYYLIDIVDAGYKYNVAEYQRDFTTVFNKLQKRGEVPILCGGTGLYIDAVLNDYSRTQIPLDYNYRNKLELLEKDELLTQLNQFDTEANSDYSTKKRIIRLLEQKNIGNNKPLIQFNNQIIPFVIGINPDRETRRERIETRLKYRLENGLIEEVEQLIKQGVNKETLTFYGLEYKFVVQFLNNEFNLKELEEKLCIAIQQYAKRQMTYFRGMERKGLKINWINF